MIDNIFSKQGVLGSCLPAFEEREEQKEMARLVFEAYEKDHIALIEAATGTGKSLAYLFAALYHAIRHKTKTVIATKTIALQEQLLHKDIPFFLKALDAELSVCLVKGMGNYICKRKLAEYLEKLLLTSLSEMIEMQKIEEQVERRSKVSFSELPFSVTSGVKEKIGAESHSCNHVHCPFYKECGFFRDRKKAQEASLLVVNHHLLLSDMKRKKDTPGQESILPVFDRLIIDEAHHFEQVALDSLAERWQRMDLVRALSKLSHEGHLLLLKQTLASHVAVPPSLEVRFEIDLPAQKQLTLETLETFFLLFKEVILFFSSEKSGRLRVTHSVLENQRWQEIVKATHLLIDALRKISQGISSLFQELQPFSTLPFFPSLSASLAELSSIADRLTKGADLLEVFIKEEQQSPSYVRWIEWTEQDLILVEASLDVSSLLEEHLFSKLKTVLLCSATLATGASFDPLKKRLGFKDDLKELIVQSPFDFSKRTLFTVPLDVPLPSSPDFFSAFIDLSKAIIDISRGSTLILFTSYMQLKQAAASLSSLPYPLLCQGDLSRHALLEKFRAQEGSVLLATDSFWEGVDIPGEALRCVIIVKLPFAVPSDPLQEAYAEALEQSGKDPFLDFSVPQAVIKFKQGFGRLMRHHKDRGCVVCLDHRIVTKRYGKQFLQSLPECKTFFGKKEDMLKEMQKFYSDVKPGA
ncbi:MAG: hypothetical protein RLZZ453_819 [Chlamydiota bacterium]|jgi:ATP-dependent DNA helicase DinG